MPVMVQQSNGWAQLVQMRGFRHHRIEAHIQDVNGSPRVTELRVMLAVPATPRAITDNMLRSIDLRAVAKWSHDVAQPELQEDLLETARRILKTKPHKRRVTDQDVAKLWLAAREKGAKDPRKQVVQALAREGTQLSERTISRYLGRAREQGLIPEHWR
jgi:CRP-like cAMP-binding protein